MATKGLEYVISLVDQVSKPVAGIMREIDRLGSKGKAAMEQIAFGAAGIAATGIALKGALNPAIEMSNALSNITATGMGAEGLAKVEKFALDFSSTFGIAATDVVDSANEIIRAINGLTDDEVISFTKASNILAKATGSNAQQMGSYLSTMYGLFKNEADRMGKSKWVEQMAAQATYTANMYKSSGESLSLAFSNLTSKGTEAGIEMAEQFAVIGNLQNVMDGAKAGTVYRSFLENAMNSKKMQKKLGLTFIDEKGSLLSITKIIEKIKKKFGHLGKAALTDILTDAFGVGSSAAGLFINDMERIDSEIKDIRQNGNLDEAIRISHIVTDTWERFANILINIKTVIGRQVLAKIQPFLDRIADAGTYFVKWLNVNKNIARWLGYIVGGMMALTAVIPAIMLITGLFKLWKIGGLLLWATLKGLTKFAFGGFIKIAFSVFRLLAVFKIFTSFAFAGFIKIAFSVLRLLSPMGIILSFVFLFRKQIWAFIQGAIQGFQDWGVSFAPVQQALSQLWGVIGNIGNKLASLLGLSIEGEAGLNSWATAGETFGKVLGGVVEFIINGLAYLINIFGIVLDTVANVVVEVITMWKNVIDKITNGDILGAIKAVWDGVLNIIKNVWKGVERAFIETVNFIIKGLNLIGADIKPIELPIEVQPLPDITAKTSAVGGIANMAIQSGSQEYAIPKPNLAIPKGKTLSSVANNQNKTVINHINVTAKTDAPPQDIARAIAENKELGII